MNIGNKLRATTIQTKHKYITFKSAEENSIQPMDYMEEQQQQHNINKT